MFNPGTVYDDATAGEDGVTAGNAAGAAAAAGDGMVSGMVSGMNPGANQISSHCKITSTNAVANLMRASRLSRKPML